MPIIELPMSELYAPINQRAYLEMGKKIKLSFNGFGSDDRGVFSILSTSEDGITVAQLKREYGAAGDIRIEKY